MRRIRAESDGVRPREFEWREVLGARGGRRLVENYLRAAALAVGRKVGRRAVELTRGELGFAGGGGAVVFLGAAGGVDAGAAARESNGRASFEELMEILPEGEQFVGTRGGGMDHAASLGSRAGYASLITSIRCG